MKIMIKRILCVIKAIPFFLKTGELIPHVWEEKECYPAMQIWVSDKGFRVFESSYQHAPNEHIEKNVTLHGLECKYCGKKMMLWSKGEIPTIITEDDYEQG